MNTDFKPMHQAEGLLPMGSNFYYLYRLSRHLTLKAIKFGISYGEQVMFR